MPLTRDDILKADDLKRELVGVPEWGGEVWVRTLTGQERDDFEASLVIRRGKKQDITVANIRAKLVAKSCVDESGKPLFTEADVAALAGKSGAALDRVFAAAQRLSGLSDNDVEELAKNS